ncbi:MAG: SseB family protein [Blautia sp.]
MDKKKIEVLQKLQKMEAFYVLFSRGTNNPFIICDPESYNDQVWIFEENKDLEEMAKPLIENKNALAAIKVENKSFLHFFTTLISIGVNAVMFVEKDRKTEFDLEEIIRKPDYSNLPEKERPLLNPEMQISAIYFMQELRRGVKLEEKPTLKDLEEEMAANLVKSKFLLAVEAGKEGEQMQVPYIKDKDGNIFQPVFTDPGEFSKFNGKKKFRAVMVEFKNMKKVVIPDAVGIVVNPQGFNLIVKKDKFDSLLQRFGISVE